MVSEPDGSNAKQITDFAIIQIIQLGEPGDSVIWSPDSSRMMFHDSDGLLYTAHADGTNISRATSEPVVYGVGGDGPTSSDTYTTAVWSPNSTKIAYTTHDDYSHTILHVVDADGSNLVQIVEDSYYWYSDTWRWSPDGSKIAYGTRGDDLFVADTGGLNRVQVADGVVSAAGSNIWSWAPDSSKVAYDASGGLFVVDVDGANRVQIADNVLSGGGVWSPDGRKIVYATIDGLFVVDVDGSSRVQIENAYLDGCCDWRPATWSWSPDSTKIAYITNSVLLQVVDADGTNGKAVGEAVFVPDMGWFAPTGHWSPDSHRIAIAALDGQGHHVVAVDSDGRNRLRLEGLVNTDFAGTSNGLAWSPDSERLLFLAKVDSELELSEDHCSTETRQLEYQLYDVAAGSYDVLAAFSDTNCQLWTATHYFDAVSWTDSTIVVVRRAWYEY